MPDNHAENRGPDPAEALSASREREVALREILQVIRQSRDDEKPVFDMILDNAARLCSAPLAAVGLVDRTRMQYNLVASLGARSEFMESPGAQNVPLDSPAAAARAIRTMQPVHVDDMADDDLYREGHPVRVATVDIEGARTFLAVPLIQEGHGIGVIVLYRREVRPFSAAEIALVETFAEQAVIAIEKVRQFREVQVRLEREAATREILSVISRSPDDELPVFDVILKNACRLCGSQLAFMAQLDETGEYVVCPAQLGTSPEFAAVLEHHRTPLATSPLGSAVSMRERRVVRIDDIADDELYRSGNESRVFMVETEGIRSLLVVPLISGERGIGAILLYRREVDPFTDEDAALVQTFAAQAVIAIENVRQFRELQVRLEREAATGEVLQIISQSRDDEMPVFEAILERAARLCQAQSAGLQLVNNERTHLRFVVGWGPDKSSFKPGEEFDLNGPLGLATAAREARVVQIEDLKDGQLYREGHPQRVKLVDEEGVRTQLSVPLLKDGIAFGTMTLSRQDVKAFSADEIALVETFAAQAVIAIENVRQFREVQTRLERERASAEILEAISRNREDEQPVLDTIVRNAVRLTHAKMAGISLANEARTELSYAAVSGSYTDQFPKGYKFDLAGPLQVAVTVREARLIHTPDLAEDPLYAQGDPVRRTIVDEVGIRTFLTVPLIKNGVAFGCLNLNRDTVQPFDPDELQMIETFAAQAVIAIENVRQYREVQERLEREAATREILQVINQNRSDTAPVFQAILENARRLCDAPMAMLSVANEDRTRVAVPASLGARDAFAEALKSFDHSIDENLIAVRPIADGQIIHMTDCRDDDLYRDGHPTRLLLADVEGVRSILAVPMVRNGSGIGAIILYRREVQPFDTDQIDLVKSFAEQAAIAIENVRQFREVQTRLERERASAEVLEVISRSRADTAPVFSAILESAARLCLAPHALLLLPTADNSHLELAASNSATSKFIENLRKTPHDLSNKTSAAVLAYESGKTQHVPDVRELFPGKDRAPQLNFAADIEGMRTVLLVPLLIGEQSVGVISVYKHEVAPFTEGEIALVETFASQAVIAIENVRQFREVQARLEREAASREILQVISQSRDDEQPVFDAILRNASRLCHAPIAWLMLADDERRNFIFTAVHGDELQAMRIGEAFSLDSPYQIAQTIREGRTTEIPDLVETEFYRNREPVYVKLVEEEGLRSRINVPLIQGGKAIGCIVLSRREVDRFSGDEIALLETFAAQAVIAIENVRQFRELQERLEREAATREILQVINQSRNDYTPVFNAILENAAKLCDAPVAGLHLVNDERTRHQLECVWGADPGLTEVGEDFDLDSPLQVSTCIRESRIIHTPDLADDPLYRDGNPMRVRLVDEEGVRTFLSVPLVKDGVAFGCFNLNRTEVKPFSQADIELMETFAEQAVVAIENVRQFKALEDRTAEVESLNAGLEERVAKQVGEIERMGRLKRFLSPAVADAVVSAGDDRILGSHRALIATLFCDIRGFTAFCETAEPEETIEVLQTYHEAMGVLIAEHGAGVDTRAGDGIMVIFNDPLPCDDPTGDALRLAFAMRERMTEMCQSWKRLGHRLGFGVGISLGYATVGMVGASGRYDYTASGTAVNLAARLCDHAQDGEILLSPRAYTAVEDTIEAEAVGELEFKGIRTPVAVFRATAMKG